MVLQVLQKALDRGIQKLIIISVRSCAVDFCNVIVKPHKPCLIVITRWFR
jgi:hypothetical protein